MLHTGPVRNSFSCSKEQMLVYLCSMYKISPVSLHKIQTVLSSISIQHRPTYLSLADFSSHSVITITLRERQEIRPSKREPCFIMGILYHPPLQIQPYFSRLAKNSHSHIMSGSQMFCFLTIYLILYIFSQGLIFIITYFICILFI